MPWPFDTLVSTVQGAFSRATADYNQVKTATDALEKSNRQLQQGVVRTGFTNIFVNRYYGLANLQKLPAKAQDGAHWAYYFAFCPHLEKDVQASAVQWAYEHMHAPTFHGLKVAVATAGGTTPDDARAFKNAAQARVNTQMQALAVSVAAGSTISFTLKKAGQYAKNDYMKLGLHYGRRTWQVTGILAFAYGLSKIADAMHETGPFASSLKQRRDTFNKSQTWKISEETEQAMRMIQDI